MRCPFGVEHRLGVAVRCRQDQPDVQLSPPLCFAPHSPSPPTEDHTGEGSGGGGEGVETKCFFFFLSFIFPLFWYLPVSPNFMGAHQTWIDTDSTLPGTPWVQMWTVTLLVGTNCSCPTKRSQPCGGKWILPTRAATPPSALAARGFTRGREASSFLKLRWEKCEEFRKLSFCLVFLFGDSESTEIRDLFGYVSAWKIDVRHRPWCFEAGGSARNSGSWWTLSQCTWLRNHTLKFKLGMYNYTSVEMKVRNLPALHVRKERKRVRT